MFKFKFTKNNDGEYVALLTRLFSNLDSSEDVIKRKGGETLDGFSVKIIIYPELLHGDKFYIAYLVVNDFHKVAQLGSGWSIFSVKEEISEWFINYFLDFARGELPGYAQNQYRELSEYYQAWQKGSTPHQLEELKKMKDKEVITEAK